MTLLIPNDKSDRDFSEREVLEQVKKSRCISCEKKWNDLAPITFTFLSRGEFLWWHFSFCRWGKEV